MRLTSELFRLAEHEGIVILWRQLRPGRVGLYVAPSGDEEPVIVLDPWLEHRERWLRVVLAHELGHHFTATEGWLRLAAKNPGIASRSEAAARRWALDFLLPDREFVRFWRRSPSLHEAADHFYVPESTVIDKLSYMQARGGLAA